MVLIYFNYSIEFKLLVVVCPGLLGSVGYTDKSGVVFGRPEVSVRPEEEVRGYSVETVTVDSDVGTVIIL